MNNNKVLQNSTTKLVKSFFNTIICFCLVCMFLSCGKAETSNSSKLGDTIKSNASNNKILIVYFSRAGENYSVGQISIGNTARMASFIKDYTGGDIFEIIPSVAYPNSYEETKIISQKEIANNARPAIKNPLNNIDQYSTIFIGSPIWYGAPPMIMRKFYETYKNQLADRILIPFGTHEGSGISSCLSLMKEYFPKANILESFGLEGHKVSESRETVEDWLSKIGIQKKDK